MILRIALFLSMAFGIAGLGGVGWLALRNTPAAPPAVVVQNVAPAPVAPPAKVAVLMSAKPLRAGALLKPDDFTVREMDASAVPENAAVVTKGNHNELVGAMVRRMMGPNETLLTGDVMLPGDRGFLAAVLSAGMRAATVGVDAVSGSANLIWPGDRVDLILTMALEGPQLAPGKKLSGETVMKNVRVVAVDSSIMRGAVGTNDTAQQSAKTLTLEVTPEQAERVAVALRMGKVAVVVRAADDSLSTDDDGERTTWAGDVSRALGPTTTESGTTVHVFTGAADGKEYHF